MSRTSVMRLFGVSFIWSNLDETQFHSPIKTNFLNCKLQQEELKGECLAHIMYVSMSLH